MENWILAVDPGNVESAYALLDPELRPIRFGKLPNEEMYSEAVQAIIANVKDSEHLHIAVEMIASYGMPVGKEVFDTCVWIGALMDRFKHVRNRRYIYRKDEKMAICHSMQANDATIKQALVDRFASGVPNHGKGSKKEPGWFYGFKADVWAAYAVGVTYHDLYLEVCDG